MLFAIIVGQYYARNSGVSLVAWYWWYVRKTLSSAIQNMQSGLRALESRV
jgi:hypothetical protein